MPTLTRAFSLVHLSPERQRSVDLSDHFDGVDFYELSVDEPEIASAIIVGDRLTIEGRGVGEARITITAFALGDALLLGGTDRLLLNAEGDVLRLGELLEAIVDVSVSPPGPDLRLYHGDIEITPHVLAKPGVRIGRGALLSRHPVTSRAGSLSFQTSYAAEPLHAGDLVRVDERLSPDHPYQTRDVVEIIDVRDNPDRERHIVRGAGPLYSLANRRGLTVSRRENIRIDEAIQAVLVAAGATRYELDTSTRRVTLFQMDDDDDVLSTLKRLAVTDGPYARLYERGDGTIVFSSSATRLLEQVDFWLTGTGSLGAVLDTGERVHDFDIPVAGVERASIDAGRIYARTSTRIEVLTLRGVAAGHIAGTPAAFDVQGGVLYAIESGAGVLRDVGTNAELGLFDVGGHGAVIDIAVMGDVWFGIAADSIVGPIELDATQLEAAAVTEPGVDRGRAGRHRSRPGRACSSTLLDADGVIHTLNDGGRRDRAPA